MRIKVTLSYDGSRFDGFQSQKHTKNTVMHALYEAFGKLGIKSKIVGSGRTDKGVHATRQIIHTDLPSFWSDLEKITRYLNRYLHPAIHIRKVERAPEDFHARYSARKRAYRYILSCENFDPFRSHYVTFIENVDRAALRKSIKLFEGTHDFGYFLKTGGGSESSVRTIYKAYSYSFDEYTILYFEANGFLRAQVRMMVDFLLKISKKELTLSQLREQLEKKVRHSSTLAPPNGLYLCNVIY